MPSTMLRWRSALSKNAQRAKEAEQHFLQAIELDSNNAQHYALLGSLYTRLGLPRRAESVYRQALKLDPPKRRRAQRPHRAAH